MRVSNGLSLLALACLASADLLKARDYSVNDYFTLHLERDASPEAVASALGLTFEGKVGELAEHYYFSAPRGLHGAEEKLEQVRSRRRKREVLPEGLESILWSQKQQLKPRMEKRGLIPPPARRDEPNGPDESFDDVVASTAAVAERQDIARTLGIQDPIFAEQWHLFNSIELGHDVNVTGLWLEGITGEGATVAIVDDGLDMYSKDLKDNYFAEGSYDFNDHVAEPRPKLGEDHHGTRCAGEVAAVKNDVCGIGVAYNSKVAGLRILSKAISDEDEAVAINYKMDKNQIYSCSWGPPDNGKAMDAPGLLIKRAMLNGIQKGRGGKGSIFVFAAGNGAASDDNCNFDGYTNSIYSITVGAIDRKGLHPYYSEKCSAQLVVTYSSGSGDAIHTTDTGEANCYTNHGGTSAAAPLGAGIFALVMGVRPDLTWRDLQYLCVDTAVPVNEDEDWAKTYIGKKFSHTYGYGKLDAYGLVEAAKSFKSVKPQAWFKSPWQRVQHDIPQGNQGLASYFIVTTEMMQAANFERVEHVTITMNIDHTRRGDLSVDLISPEGMVSHIATTRRHDDRRAGYVDWTFMTVAHWGEPGVGKWTVVVKDTDVNDEAGVFVDWRLNLWGEAIKADIQELHPMPTEHDDDHTFQTAIVSTTSIVKTPATDLPTQPTDHIDRPTNSKPTSKPSPVDDSASPVDGSASSTPTPGFLLPSIFPTFGVSPRTQIWIYGALVTILVFCIALAVYLSIVRRRRAQISRADYEFEMLDDHDADGAAAPLSGAGAKPKRRAGELYDAFAGESDEEVFSEVDDEKYRDEEPSSETERMEKISEEQDVKERL